MAGAMEAQAYIVGSMQLLGSKSKGFVAVIETPRGDSLGDSSELRIDKETLSTKSS